MIIREMEIADIPKTSAMAQKTYAETFGHSMSEEELKIELQEKKSEKFFMQSIIEKNDNFLIAENESEIIGYIGLQNANMAVNGRQPSSKDQALKGIYVDSRFQGQGVGKKLMDSAFQHPRFQNAENIYLCVWKENKPAYNFYLNYGFQEVGTHDFVVDGKVIGHDSVMIKSVK